MRGVAMDPTTRARARLFLRSEAAHGQNALPLRKTQRAGGASSAPRSEGTPSASLKGEKPGSVTSNPVQKGAAKSSVSLEQAPGAMRQAIGGGSVDVFVAEGVGAAPALSREEKIRLLAELE